MGLYGWIGKIEGRMDCTVTGALPAAFLTACAAAGIELRNVRAPDPFTLKMTLRAADLPPVQALAERSQCCLQQGSLRGAAFWRKLLLRRCASVLCLAAVLAVLIWSKLFVWEIGITGNKTVSSAAILSALEDCGVYPGSFWPDYRIDAIRTRLQLRLPQIAWATVNIRGSRAEVIVRERIPKPEILDTRLQSDLIAGKIGFVTKVQTLSGTPCVKPGSAVLPGELLIEGSYTGKHGETAPRRAMGSITAKTCYSLTAVLPERAELLLAGEPVKTRWALEIGKKRVNFFRNSSICPTECVKLIRKWSCGRDGLFSLPLTLVREQLCTAEVCTISRETQLACRTLEQQLHARLVGQLGEPGSVNAEFFSACRSNGRISVCLRADCTENIAAEQMRTQEEAIS